MTDGVSIDAGKAGAWDSLSVGRPSVIYDEGIFKMWYDGRKDFPIGAPVEGAPVSNESHRFVGHATSNDGINWVRNGDERRLFFGAAKAATWDQNVIASSPFILGGN